MLFTLTMKLYYHHYCTYQWNTGILSRVFVYVREGGGRGGALMNPGCPHSQCLCTTDCSLLMRFSAIDEYFKVSIYVRTHQCMQHRKFYLSPYSYAGGDLEPDSVLVLFPNHIILGRYIRKVQAKLVTNCNDINNPHE